MKWTVSILGVDFEVEADTPYKARKEAIILFKERSGSDRADTFFLPACRIRRHEDKRVKYDFLNQ